MKQTIILLLSFLSILSLQAQDTTFVDTTFTDTMLVDTTIIDTTLVDTTAVQASPLVTDSVVNTIADMPVFLMRH